MELTKEYIYKGLKSSLQALVELEKGELRKSVGSLDYVQDRIIAAKHLIINEIKSKEGKF